MQLINKREIIIRYEDRSDKRRSCARGVISGSSSDVQHFLRDTIIGLIAAIFLYEI